MQMAPHYDLSLVGLSVLVAILASYTALSLAGSIADAKGTRARGFWLIGGSLAMGFGVWSMHFVGMLAFSMPGMVMAYDRPLMILSIIVAVAASALALYVVSNPKENRPTYLLAGIAMGIAIAGMHYLGMASMKMAARIEWNYWLVAISVLIAIVASNGALWLAFQLRGETERRSQIGRALGALGMGIAIAGMHYTGMFAAKFIHDPRTMNETMDTTGLVVSSSLTIWVISTTLAVLAIAIAGSLFDRALQKRIRQAEESDRLFREAEQAILALQVERDLRERFVSSLTHDLRTPITAASLNANLMIRVIHEPERLLQLNAKVIESLKRADQMIRDLLDAHRISANQRLPLTIDDCDLESITRQTIEELRTIHGNRFVLKIHGDFQGRWDANYLQRVLENLCSNAVKYGRANTLVTIALHNTAQNIQLSVQNEGDPLSETELSQLFNLFHRSRTAQVSGTQGWGIGLTLVKGVVESHGGKIGVTSNHQTGTTFTITLPKAAQIAPR
jgi:NO-binding membrane sensor protein with MHYT domain/two-component sensor histidine kinase